MPSCCATGSLSIVSRYFGKESGNDFSGASSLFIVHPQALSGGKGMGFFTSLFSTHPDTQKRIEILEQF